MKFFRELFSAPFFLVASLLIGLGLVLGFMASFIDGTYRK